MSLQFARRCSVIAGELKVPEQTLRVQFSIKKTLKKDPNTAEVTLTNLSKDSRSKCQKKHEPLIVNAGYRGYTAILFSGDIREVSSVRSGADWNTIIHSGDGEHQYQYAYARESFGPGTRPSDVLSFLVSKLAINGGNAIARVGLYTGKLQSFPHGYTVSGRASFELDRLMKSLGLSWSIQNGALQVLGKNETAPVIASVLSAETGLIGSPEFGTPDKKTNRANLRAKSLLNPALVPGGAVVLKSEAVSGNFKVETVTHTGDTHGTAWHSELDLVPP